MSLFSFSNDKPKRQFLNIKSTKISKSSQDTLAFIEAYENGIFKTAENTYSLMFEIENIDYRLLRDPEQNNIYRLYQQYLNALPSEVCYQEFLMNIPKNSERLRKAMIPEKFSPKNKEESEIFESYSDIQEHFIKESEKSSAEKKLIGVLSYTVEGKMDNAEVLFKYYVELQRNLQEMGSNARQLMTMEVFELLYSYYHPFTAENFFIPQKIASRGSSLKDYIAPSSFVFMSTRDYFQMGSAYGRILSLAVYPNELADKFISDLLDNSYHICVSKHIVHVDKGDAMTLIRKEMFDVQEKIQKRMKDNHKDGTNFIPFKYLEQSEELKNFQEQLSSNDTQLFEVSVLVGISAKTLEELDSLTTFVVGKAKNNQVVLKPVSANQEAAMNSLLPYGVNRMTIKNRSNISLFLLSDAVGVLIPFSARTYFAENGLNYGLNDATGDVILLDRTEEMNSNGFILGTSGSGKSLFSKLETFETHFKHPDDYEIILVDPEQEYVPLADKLNAQVLKLRPNSPTKLNVFDTNINYVESDGDALTMKSEFIMTMTETAKGQVLTAAEKSMLDKCVKASYHEFMLHDGDEKYLPTLTTLYEILGEQKDTTATDLQKILELYVTGSFNNFAGHTNIESTSNRIIIDISDMGQQLRTVGLQVIFEYLWQRVRQNHQKGIRTVIINDEISSMFLDGNYYANIDSSGQFYQKIFKRIRKYGGYVTGITQNISQVLDSPQARTMLSNASFIVLLQQAEDDLERIKDLFKLSPTHLSCISSGKVGTGIIICGKKIIPFSKALPPDIIKTNALYKFCSTKFNE